MAEEFEAKHRAHHERVKTLTVPDNLQPGDTVRYVGPTSFTPKADVIGKLVKIEGDTAIIEVPAVRNHFGQEITGRQRKVSARYIEKVG